MHRQNKSVIAFLAHHLYHPILLLPWTFLHPQAHASDISATHLSSVFDYFSNSLEHSDLNYLLFNLLFILAWLSFCKNILNIVLMECNRFGVKLLKVNDNLVNISSWQHYVLSNINISLICLSHRNLCCQKHGKIIKKIIVPNWNKIPHFLFNSYFSLLLSSQIRALWTINSSKSPGVPLHFLFLHKGLVIWVRFPSLP